MQLNRKNGELANIKKHTLSHRNRPSLRQGRQEDDRARYQWDDDGWRRCTKSEMSARLLFAISGLTRRANFLSLEFRSVCVCVCECATISTLRTRTLGMICFDVRDNSKRLCVRVFVCRRNSCSRWYGAYRAASSPGFPFPPSRKGAFCFSTTHGARGEVADQFWNWNLWSNVWQFYAFFDGNVPERWLRNCFVPDDTVSVAAGTGAIQQPVSG